MLTALQLLNEKRSNSITSINSSANAGQAMKLLVKNNVDAVTVMEKGEIRGIFSERDYARYISSNEHTHNLPAVNKVMTRKVVCIKKDIELIECISLIKNIKVDYLLVLDDSKVIGIIAVCDLEKAIIDQQQKTIDHLSKYICGNL
jgi:predicted transcriptional regulator